ncbi:VOC family virulence protein [Micromonospora sp. KC606]|uniref:VOC family protein n=1 Tax=Micromonospora sp. KC606 TaxID=2530379 RepID=UPI00104C1A29|nr:VOC family protein [Micromonospora sp. KC606]TDC82890.1 VOC family virulence protein [Micromonospora sp. KC606]
MTVADHLAALDDPLRETADGPRAGDAVSAVRITGFDHLVLTVADVQRSLDFYCGRLGLLPVRVDEWRSGLVPFPSVRVSPESIIDLVHGDRGGTNVDHFCLVVEPLDWAEVVASGVFTVLEGPVGRFGARGNATSVYVRDPDGNSVELRWYPQDLP